jgi:UDP-N-acetylglucosamine 2-epimerase (non-hydrolysing)
MKLLSVVGARPNFMKIAPFIRAIDALNKTITDQQKKIQHILVHTGQHYDDRMSQEFFNQLGIPEADINLNIGSGSHAEQVGLTMIEFEKVIKREKPDWVVVVGDVNAILACSVTAKKENIKCCHIEAGLRSGDMSMPEEVNRLVADRISDLLLTPDIMSSDNLLKEGVPESRISLVGNIMIDTLETFRSKAEILKVIDIINTNSINESWKYLEAEKAYEFVTLTLHRPSNVDKKETLEPIVKFILEEVAQNHKVIWPIHPRTRKVLNNFGLWDKIFNSTNILLLESLGYLEMLKINMISKMILTDSGGLQEECTVLGTPCLTLRWNTERPITLKEHGGASVLVGNSINGIRKEFLSTLEMKRLPRRPMLWDGNTAERCLKAILNYEDRVN